MSDPSMRDTAAADASPGAGDANACQQQRLCALIEELQTLAGQLEGQPAALLDLLRRLEQLHRSIQDGPFRASLPAERNQLFRLLQEIESSGGWPYIPRLQLRTFIDLMAGPPAAGSVPGPGDPALAA